MSYENIVTEIKDHVALVTVNRPEKLNALNKQTIGELHNAFQSLNENPQVRCIILTGAQNKAFVAGADIKEFADFSAEEGAKLSAEGHEVLFNYIENLSTPVIAAINGYALGGGLELAMSAHFRIASENAMMGLPEVTLGVIPGYGGTQRLAKLIGKGKAMEMILTASMINAQEASRLKLVNYVVPYNELLLTALKLAQKIAQNSPFAVAKAIEAVNASDNGKSGFDKEIEAFGACFGTPDFKEGTAAFLEKRKPQF